MADDPTRRFSNRVDNYIKYRPGYPDEVINLLQNECGLSNKSVLADIGSGTGIFTAMLLNHGYKVYAVEPNAAMQQAAVRQLGANKNFVAVDANAEATTLPSNSIHLIVCAQAFHWFNNEKTKAEFKRVLKGEGYIALIWNNRLADADEFSIAYENLLNLDGTDYTQVNHRNISDADLKSFFKDGVYKTAAYPNEQVFDEEGFLGRAFSSSYVPAEDTDAGRKFKESLKAMFNRYSESGKVSFYYDTEVYLGKV